MAIIAEIESPYRGEDEDAVRRNILYARIACRWALERGYFPYASHLFFTQPGILDDGVAAERARGIEAGKAIARRVAEATLLFLDLGVSEGMAFGVEDAQARGRDVREVRLFEGQCLKDATYAELLGVAERAGLLPGGYERMGW